MRFQISCLIPRMACCMYCFRTGLCFVASLVLMEFNCWGQNPADWEHGKATAECTGLRVYSNSISNAIAGSMRDASKEEYPGIRVFLASYDKAYSVVDEKESPLKWPLVNVQKLVVNNGSYWRAFYEIRPADPFLMWFHSAFYGRNGQANRTFYSQQIAVHTPHENKLQAEMFRLIISSRRLTSLGDAGVMAGNELERGEQWQRAVDTYSSVLKVIPKHAFALFEMGQAANSAPPNVVKIDRKKLLRESRRQNPFRMEAYQGDFSRKEFQELIALRQSAVPAWNAFQKAGTETAFPFVKLEGLSVALQTAGLHELALLSRQLVVARRPESYNDADSEFIKRSLKALCPNDDFTTTLNRFRDQVAPFSIRTLKPSN